MFLFGPELHGEGDVISNNIYTRIFAKQYIIIDPAVCVCDLPTMPQIVVRKSYITSKDFRDKSKLNPHHSVVFSLFRSDIDVISTNVEVLTLLRVHFCFCVESVFIFPPFD